MIIYGNKIYDKIPPLSPKLKNLSLTELAKIKNEEFKLIKIQMALKNWF